MTYVQSHESNLYLSYSKNHALDPSMLPISRVKEIAQFAKENRQRPGEIK